MIDLRKSQTPLITIIAIIGSLVFVSACTHRRVVQVGSHRVTIARHGFQKTIKYDSNARVPTFEYKGASAAGSELSITIKGNKVTVNDVDYGKLRDGDSVLIGDSGVAVNDLDYGESEKYLRANGSASEATAQN